ncbi:CPBP family intramembrane glutamic endopeptidase [Pontibacter cellulosilyticus]|uniref:CPBP family intramembrane metalloprotease n=1 Tax=Pontibacter cellulosilyticus TaxID=1720253 RepID=A0A923SKS0_9BACT|nr:CPBP family intramembrane glutamic endopeptidase [Pontibacter cellulosilyticus]MBC5995047.1 CPBP family intramembrane metalloprotease [Pontibacter cellulosilyticus]
MQHSSFALPHNSLKPLIPSMLILPVTFAAFYFLPQVLGKTTGYLASFILYWVFCWVHGLYLKRGSLAELYMWPAPNKLNIALSILCFVPVVGAFAGAFMLAYDQLSLPIYLILAAVALINGFTEEFYWRGAFISRYKQNILLAYAVPTLLFGLWHVSVYAAYGVNYQGGFWPLVGGAFFMGALWGYTAFKQQRILIPTIAHVLANFFAFSNLIVENWMK